ncbi:uncharacterized protein PHACADRAFT_89965 [Phanerochaete carnosa HHB-10118-sp]|uniref:Uncharacterized protein n=1 Tax=Phanerochaete carnosa (strain HHB-10118-sp) TaxID=650164 RepID=K5X6H3_PHACS|nr:uncharacterized protein PHACADRAFT_89965 [Phanerochaete carnosa HHB-10118-sp]EKM58457.1 hypothetical protein PHACADRAFT_89965 [Phanerochaete carnosa HHB-10118-sp]
MDALQIFRRSMRDFDPVFDSRQYRVGASPMPLAFAGDSTMLTTAVAHGFAELKNEIAHLYAQRREYQKVTDAVVRERECRLRKQQADKQRELSAEQTRCKQLEEKLRAADEAATAAQAEYKKLGSELKATKISKRRQTALFRERAIECDHKDIQLQFSLHEAKFMADWAKQCNEIVETQRSFVMRKRDAAEKQVSNLMSERDAIAVKLVDLEKRLHIKKANLSLVATAFASAREEVSSLQERLRKKDAWAVKMAQGHFCEIQELEDGFIQSQDFLDAQAAQTAAGQTMHAAALRSIESKDIALEEAERAAREQAEDFRGQLKEMRRLLEDANMTISLQVDQIRQLSAERDDYKARAEEAAERARNEKTEKDALAEELRHAKEDIAGSQAKATQLRAAKVALQAQLTTERDAHAKACRELEATQTRISLMVDELEMLRSSMDAAREDTDKIRRELEVSGARIELLVDERDALKAKLSAARSETRDTRRELIAAEARAELIIDERDRLRDEEERLRRENAFLISQFGRAQAASSAPLALGISQKRDLPEDEDENAIQAPPCKKAKLDSAIEDLIVAVVVVLPASDSELNVNAAVAVSYP